MNRLLYVMPYTTDIEGMKAFYRDKIGLSVGNESPFFVSFGGGRTGASLALLAIEPAQERRIELCFETDDVDADFAELQERGVKFLNEPRTQPFGRVVHLHDPEGRLVSLLQPAPGAGAARTPSRAKADPPWKAGTAGASANSALAVAVDSPRFSTVILNCRDMAPVKAFYRDKLRLSLETDSPWWVSFDAGGSTLALHPLAQEPEHESHHGQSVTLGFTVGDVMEWVDAARDEGVEFTEPPADRGFGVFTDVADPDGNELTFREPPTPPVLEEELAEEYENEAAPTRGAIRKPLKKGTHAVSRVAVKPEYKSGTAARKSARGARKKDDAPSAKPASQGTRMIAKDVANAKRAKGRPATGRLKKAEARTKARKKTAMASASKGKPIKRAAAARGKKKR